MALPDHVNLEEANGPVVGIAKLLPPILNSKLFEQGFKALTLSAILLYILNGAVGKNTAVLFSLAKDLPRRLALTCRCSTNVRLDLHYHYHYRIIQAFSVAYAEVKFARSKFSAF